MMSLQHLWTVFRREVSAYFNSTIAYIFIIVFVLLNAGLYMMQFFIYARADMRPFFATLPFLLAVFLPAVTMRLWAEERKGNTLELLLTFPMGTHVLVLGKFLASLIFYLVALSGTLIIPLMLHFLGKPDLGVISGAYFGSVLLGAFFLAIGIFISGLCRDQIVAFILGMMVCFSIFLIGTEFIAASIDGWLPGFGSLLRNFFGAARHYDSFSKGVLDSRDLLYFTIGTVIFLILNGFWMEGRMRPKAKTTFTTVAAICVGIFFMSNWLFAGIPLGRFDLSEGRIYTISPATKKILSELKAPVSAKLFISPAEKMPTSLKTLEREIQDKLDEFRVASNGNFQYKIFHLEAVNAEGAGADSLEQQISEKGIRPFQVQSITADELGVHLVYSAISLAYKEKPEQIIPRITPDNIYELEYLLASRIYRMNMKEVPKVALVAPYQEKEVEPELKQALEGLGGQVPKEYREDLYEVLPMGLQYTGYEVSRIKISEKEPIPEGTKTLIVIEPHEFSERQNYEMNRFLRAGGSIFLAVQKYQYKYTAVGKQELTLESEEKKPNVDSLLSHWGLQVDDQILLDRQHDVVNLSGAARIGPFEVSIPVKIPIQILIPPSGMNPEVSITSRLSTLFYLWGTALKLDEKKIAEQKLSVRPLLQSSTGSWTVPFKAGSLTAADLEPKDDSMRGPFPLAVLAEGQFADAFEGKAIPAWSQVEAVESKSEEPAKSAEIKSGKLILVGASSFLQKNLIRSGGHLNFFLNSVDALTLGDELVTIRSKQPIDRSIGTVSAATKVSWRLLVTVLIPVFIAFIGTLRLFLRRQSKQNYLKALALVE